MAAILCRQLLRVGVRQARCWHAVRSMSIAPKLPREPSFDAEEWHQPPDGEDLSQLPKPHSVMKDHYLTEQDKLENGIWPWESGTRGRLPEHYKQHYMEFYTREAEPVHYVPDPRKYTVDEYGTRRPVINHPIPLFFPKEADEGLWGGEGFVIGLRKRQNKKLKPRVPRIWKPKLFRRVFYSEILNQHMEITVTLHLLDLIDAAHGFDHYILKTPSIDMRSQLGMALKRNMLLTLARKSMYPDDPAKCEAVYGKYEQYVIPAEEAEWIGLTLRDAEEKQQELEEREDRMRMRPLKEVYAEELIEKLRQISLGEGDDDDDLLSSSESKGWMSKLNPFKDEKS